MKNYKSKNIGCASCPLKIEKNLKKLDIDLKKKLLPLLMVFPVFILGIVFQEQLHESWYQIPEYFLFVGIYILAGWRVIFSAFKNIFKGRVFDENFLMTMATTGAIFIHALPEAAGVMLFYKLGELFEKLSVTHSRKSIESLLSIRPDYANLQTDQGYRKVAPGQVKINDLILVKPGERVPLDGVVLDGESTVDTSALTGESMPRIIRKGQIILSGMIVLSGSLYVKVTKLFGESSIARIFNLVQNAVRNKAPTEKFITTFARYYTPVVVVLALAVAFIPPFLLNWGTFGDWLYRALVILVVSCPCALVISIPLGYFGGIGAASHKGILIKGSNFIDKICRLNTVIFDKTGTLTKGIFAVTEVVARNGFKQQDVLKYAAYAESQSNHPIALSIKQALKRDIDEKQIVNIEEVAGLGVKALLKKHDIIVGNDKFLHRERVIHKDCHINQTVLYVVVDKKYAGYIIISDVEKTDARQAVMGLKRAGISEIGMLTGDNRDVAGYYAEKLGLDSYQAELLPAQKLEYIEKIRKNSRARVAFVGDGINDAPVIAGADVGIAMGKLGSDVAIETADVVLMTDAPSKLIEAIKISKKTRKIVIENIILALAIKLIFIAFGALGHAGMWEAVFADVGVTILAVLNTLRVLRDGT